MRPVSEYLRDLAALRPNDTAISIDNVEVTFAELESLVAQRAAGISHNLSMSGNVGVLPVLVDYSFDAIVNILACLWLRQAFSPIDSSTPPARMAQLLEYLDNPPVVLVSPHDESVQLPGGLRPLETTPGGKKVEPKKPVSSDTALVVMTSGSTGTPKAVAISWRVIDYRILTYFAGFGRTELPVRVTSLAPINFVAGLHQVITILHGAHLLRFDPKRHHPSDLLKLLALKNPTHLFLPSQLFRILAKVARSSKLSFSDCRVMSVGGESVRFEDIHKFRHILPSGVVFRHVLGASECLTYLSYTVSIDHAPHTGQVPVGTGHIPDTTKLVPTGDNLHEVWCSGPIATAYLGQATLTAERFVDDEDGVTWWKSGDVVSLNEDGNVFHRGRVDDLIKVRGKLASPSELTLHLLQFPGVVGAVVLVETHADSPFFVAHVEVTSPETFSRKALEESLANALESHLLPKRIQVWSDFPVNAHGKVDRKSLANPGNLFR